MCSLQASSTWCLHRESQRPLGPTQAEAALHPRTTHVKMQTALLAWGLTHFSTNMEEVSFFMRSRFTMCEYQELLAHDDCRCLSHTVVFILILTFVWYKWSRETRFKCLLTKGKWGKWNFNEWYNLLNVRTWHFPYTCWTAYDSKDS